MASKYDPKLCFVLEPQAVDPDPQESEAHEKSTPNLMQDQHSTNDLDFLFRHIVEPAIDGRGFRIVRSSGISFNDMMTREHENLVDDAGLVIANLTKADPIVFYCLARRMAQTARNDRPYIVTIQRRGDRNLFDIPGPFADPILYGNDLPTEGRKETSIRDEGLEAIIRARTDLTRAVQRVNDDLLDSDSANHASHSAEKGAGEPGTSSSSQSAQGMNRANQSAMGNSGEPSNTVTFDQEIGRLVRALMLSDKDDYSLKRFRDRLLDR